MVQHSEQSIAEVAKEFFSTSFIEDQQLLKKGRLCLPLQQLKPDKTAHWWLVPVAVSSRLAGYFLFDQNGDFLQFSSFAQKSGGYEDCPALKGWIDPGTILQAAKKIAGDHDILHPPFLSYDGAPQRIVWRIEAQRGDGSRYQILVAGEFAYVK